MLADIGTGRSNKALFRAIVFQYSALQIAGFGVSQLAAGLSDKFNFQRSNSF